jgi:hypothetical protein
MVPGTLPLFLFLEYSLFLVTLTVLIN